MFSESSPCLLGQHGSCSTAHILGTFRKHFAKPSEQVAAPDCTYLEGEDELGGRAESAEECVAHAPPEARGGVDAAEEQALPVHAHQRARQQRGGVCEREEKRRKGFTQPIDRRFEFGCRKVI